MERKVADAPVRVYPETRDLITRLRLRIGAQIGRPVTMAEMVEILANHGGRDFPALVREAERGDNE